MAIRSIVSMLQRHIPGNPTIVLEYMPGGGGRKAANYLYKAASRDGLVIANFTSSTIPQAVWGAAATEYDVEGFGYLGTFYHKRRSIFFTMKESGFSTIEDLTSKGGIRIGEQSVGFPNYNRSRLMAWLVGFKDPKFVTGYSGAETYAAMLRGELDARTTNFDSFLVDKPDWTKKNLVDLHITIEVPEGNTHPEFPNVRELGSFAKTEKERRLLTMVRSFEALGQPTVAPPGVPKDRLAILQKAFRDALSDPEFIENYKKLIGDDPTPLLPDQVEKVIRELPRDTALVELYQQIAGGRPLPPR
jgi:tripartite-type tricarboxylate transporter receptor subunit TctC